MLLNHKNHKKPACRQAGLRSHTMPIISTLIYNFTKMTTLKTTLRYILRFLLGFIAFILLYLLFAFLLPYIKSNPSFENTSDGVEIYIQSNGVHTDIVMPIKSEHINWDKVLPYSDFVNVNEKFNYVAVGWGDKGFFLDTPTWDDLTFSTAFKAAFGLGTTAMHVTYKYKTPKLNESCKKIIISKEQYLCLIDCISSSFQFKDGKPIWINHPGYTQQDCFYEAKGTYSMFYTCNVWTGQTLKAAGIKVGVWTPLESGIVGHME